MILGVHGLIASSISGFDADAQAFITAAGITDATQQAAINTLVVDLKGYGIWSKMKALYPFVGGSASSHKYNLKDPRDLDAAFRLVFNGGWTHSSTGATPNGTNGYADTKCAPNNMSQNSASGFIYNRTDNTQITLNGCSNFEINDFDPNRLLYSAVNNTEQQIGIQTTTAGFWGVSRVSSTGWATYKNNNNIANKTATSLTPSTLPIFIASRNTGTPTTYGNKQIAYFSIGDGLSDTEASNLYTAVQAFQTSLSRQV